MSKSIYVVGQKSGNPREWFTESLSESIARPTLVMAEHAGEAALIVAKGDFGRFTTEQIMSRFKKLHPDTYLVEMTP